MKRILLLMPILIFFIVPKSMVAQDDSQLVVIPRPDSLQFMAHVSLWYEAYKTKDYNSSLTHGFEVIRRDETFNKYKFYTRMEEILRYMHDSTDADESYKSVYADTLIYLYDLAAKIDTERTGYYLARKAFTYEQWFEKEPEEVIEAYENAIGTGHNISDIYYDRLGIYYSSHADESNDYKLKALELYSNLSEKDPTNQLWVSRMNNLAEDEYELIEITKKSWDLDPESLEKAYKYAMTAIRVNEYETAIEPLLFLTERSPDVINYWRELARAYDKTGKTDEAIKAYNSLINLEPENRDNYLNLAIIYQGLNQLSVARSFLKKASSADPDWDYPLYIEAQIYEQAARNCIAGKFEFEDKCVYQLATDTYRQAAAKGGDFSERARSRANSIAEFGPSQEDYFFRKLKTGAVINIKGKCYDWIGRSITVP
ncbi:MAG: tetratricopeptide repeat protein [Melioribacteraceae bacterium]|nr:tetratricopeptide repeat protein [Melioribacteraceae bacterium]